MKQKYESSIHILAVAGGGVDPDKSSVVGRMIRAHSEDQGYNYDFITGNVEVSPDEYVVQTPGNQLDELRPLVERIKSEEEDAQILLVAQCLGASATMQYLKETSGDDSIKASIFAPAVSPGATLQTDRSKSRRRENDTLMRVNHLAGGTRDFTVDVEKAFTSAFQEDYFAQHEAYGDLTEEMVRQLRLGRLAIFATGRDWNPGSVESVRDIARRLAGEPAAKRVSILEEAGHSLHVPPGLSDDDEYRLRTQYERAALVVDTGVELFSDTSTDASEAAHKSA